jgi:hypothetical protein
MFTEIGAHYLARIKITLIKIDQWPSGSRLFLYFDDQLLTEVAIDGNQDSKYIRNRCGLSFNEAEFKIVKEFPHISSSMKIKINTNKNAVPDAFWGFNNVELVVYRCHRSCKTCFDYEKCTGCFENFYLKGDLCVCKEG